MKRFLGHALTGRANRQGTGKLEMNRVSCIMAVVLTAFASLFLGSALAWGTTAPADPSEACSAPSEVTRLEQSLVRTAARIAQGQPLKIVALGSSSTAGYGASSASSSYPSRLEAELRSLLPERDIVVVNRGINGEDAEEMVARLQRSVLAAHPDLVIWQVGTNALLGGYPMARERAVVRRGIRRLIDAGIDVVLMDPQYAPVVTEKPTAVRFVELVDKLGRDARVGVFRRFAIMRYWNQAEKLPFRAFVKGDGLHMNDWAYDCTARLLASAILEAVARTAPVL
jgi:lysophospholipase L1-like esterase